MAGKVAERGQYGCHGVGESLAQQGQQHLVDGRAVGVLQPRDGRDDPAESVGAARHEAGHRRRARGGEAREDLLGQVFQVDGVVLGQKRLDDQPQPLASGLECLAADEAWTQYLPVHAAVLHGALTIAENDLGIDHVREHACHDAVGGYEQARAPGDGLEPLERAQGFREAWRVVAPHLYDALARGAVAHGGGV